MLSRRGTSGVSSSLSFRPIQRCRHYACLMASEDCNTVWSILSHFSRLGSTRSIFAPRKGMDSWLIARLGPISCLIYEKGPMVRLGRKCSVLRQDSINEHWSCKTLSTRSCPGRTIGALMIRLSNAEVDLKFIQSRRRWTKGYIDTPLSSNRREIRWLFEVFRRAAQLRRFIKRKRHDLSMKYDPDAQVNGSKVET